MAKLMKCGMCRSRNGSCNQLIRSVLHGDVKHATGNDILNVVEDGRNHGRARFSMNRSKRWQCQGD